MMLCLYVHHHSDSWLHTTATWLKFSYTEGDSGRKLMDHTVYGTRYSDMVFQMWLYFNPLTPLFFKMWPILNYIHLCMKIQFYLFWIIRMCVYSKGNYNLLTPLTFLDFVLQLHGFYQIFFWRQVLLFLHNLLNNN